MPSCPNCGKYYKNASSITRHLSQPRTSCLDIIHNLVQITPSSNESLDPDESSSCGFNSNKYPELYNDGMDVDSGCNSENPEEDGEGPVREEVVDEYVGAAIGYGEGMTFMDLFDSDEFAKERELNLFYPFSGREHQQIQS